MKELKNSRLFDTSNISNDDKQQENNEKLCVVCLESNSSYAYIPCGYMCVCDKCSKNFADKCPLCMIQSNQLLKFYMLKKIFFLDICD